MAKPIVLAQIDQINTQLAEKATQVNLNTTNANVTTNTNAIATNTAQIATNTSNIATNASQIASLASGSPAGVFATLTALQGDSTANTTNGKTKTYVVTADGKWYYWNSSAWTAGAIYQSTGIANDSVTIDNVKKLIYVKYKGKGNLFKNSLNLKNKNDFAVCIPSVVIGGNTSIIPATSEFRRYEIENMAHLVCPVTTGNIGQAIFNITPNSDRTDIWIKRSDITGNTISIGCLMKSVSSKAGVKFYIGVLQYNTSKGYITANYSNDGLDSVLTSHNINDIAINASCVYLRFVIVSQQDITVSDTVTIDIAGHYLITGTSETTTYINEYDNVIQPLNVKNMLRDADFKKVLSFPTENKLIDWLTVKNGSCTIFPWNGSTSISGTPWSSAVIEHRLKNSNGVQIKTGASGTNSYIYQEIPIDKIELDVNGKFSAQVHYSADHVNSCQIGVSFGITQSDIITTQAIYSEANVSTDGILKLEQLSLPSNCMFVRIVCLVVANNETVYFWKPSVIASGTALEAVNSDKVIKGVGLQKLFEKIMKKKELVVVGSGDSLTEFGTGTDGILHTGTSYLDRICDYLQKIVGSNLNVRQIRNGNAGGLDLDILIQSENKLVNRGDSIKPDLIILASGRNDSLSVYDWLHTDTAGVGLWRMSCLEATIRKARTTNPDADIIIMLPCPRASFIGGTTPDQDENKDETFIRQNEILAQRYGCNIVYTDVIFNSVVNKGLLTEQQIWSDGLHLTLETGYYLLSQCIIDFISQSLNYSGINYKPDVSLMRRIAPLTQNFESAYRLRSDSTFTHSDFTLATSQNSQQIIIDGVTELKGLECSTQNGYIEFTKDFKNHLVLYPMNRSDAGRMGVYVDDILVDTIDEYQAGYPVWLSWMGLRKIYVVTTGSHKVVLKALDNKPTGIWYIGIV